jgi:endonuclease/exonuclease/phosphatase family metal-dependent hydrolase
VSPSSGPVLRVVTLNAASLIEPGWLERRHEILAWFDRLDPDIVCLQEVWDDADNEDSAAWLVENAAAGRWHHVFGGFPMVMAPWSKRSVRFGSAILSRWPIDGHQCVRLPVDDRPDPPHPVYVMQAELLHARTGGVDVFSTPLAPPPQQGYQRVRQVVAIDEHIRSLSDPAAASGLPPVLCGDFNAEPDSDEIRFLCGLTGAGPVTTYYQEAWRAAGRTDPGYTNDHRTNPLAAALNVALKRIDYVFVGDAFLRPGGTGLVLNAGLAFHQPITGVLASDHYGLAVEIGWPARPVL